MAGMLALDVLPPEALRVLDEMREGWGYPIAEIAASANVPVEHTRDLMRAFHAIGIAARHSFFSEDDCLIRGSGYSLSTLGGRLQSELRARSNEGAR